MNMLHWKGILQFVCHYMVSFFLGGPFVFFGMVTPCFCQTISQSDATTEQSVNSSFRKSWHESVEQMIQRGDFCEAERLLSEQDKKAELEVYRYREIMKRIKIDFPYSEKEVKESLDKKVSSYTDEQFQRWVAEGMLETRLIDNKVCYFRYGVNNLLRLEPSLARIWHNKPNQTRIEHVAELVRENTGDGKLFHPLNMEFTFRLIVPANTVPTGKTVRCWLPYAQENCVRQQEVVLIQTEPKSYTLSPKTQLQRTIYFEQQAEKNKPIEFMVRFRTKFFAQYYSESFLMEKTLSYKTDSEFYKHNTSVRLPHIIKTEQIQKLVRDVIGKESHPVKKAALLFDWVDKTYPWASSNEYSTMFCIPQYVLDNNHGDCGMKALLLISLLRAAGIPAKWQSGWITKPDESIGMHDWLEIYFEGVGWVPSDISYRSWPNSDKTVQKFFRFGHDEYRLIVNEDYGQELFPPKKFYRSEPLDFQRGEVEWEGGNLYYNQWQLRNSVKLILSKEEK